MGDLLAADNRIDNSSVIPIHSGNLRMSMDEGNYSVQVEAFTAETVRK